MLYPQAWKVAPTKGRLWFAARNLRRRKPFVFESGVGGDVEALKRVGCLRWVA
jgi:hypothetical protein